MLGTTGLPNLDEFSEKLETSFDPPPLGACFTAVYKFVNHTPACNASLTYARRCQRHMHAGDHYTHTFPSLISKHNVSLHFSLEGFHCVFPNFALIPPHYLSYSTKIELSNVSCIGRALVDRSSISL